jgi:hypothetical protein
MRWILSERWEINVEFKSENLETIEDLVLNETIIVLSWILKQQGGSLWTGSNLLRVWTNIVTTVFICHKWEEFLNQDVSRTDQFYGVSHVLTSPILSIYNWLSNYTNRSNRWPVSNFIKLAPNYLCYFVTGLSMQGTDFEAEETRSRIRRLTHARARSHTHKYIILHRYIIFTILQVLTAGSMKSTIFWDVPLCSVIEVRWSLGRMYCPHLRGRRLRVTSGLVVACLMKLGSGGSISYKQCGLQNLFALLPTLRSRDTLGHCVRSWKWR